MKAPPCSATPWGRYRRLAGGLLPAVALSAFVAACGARSAAAPDWVVSDGLEQASELARRAVLQGAAGAALADDELDRRVALLAALVDAHEYEDALAHAAILRRARPGWHSYRYHEARALLFGRAHVDGAIAAANECLAVRPDHGGCLELRGRALLDRGDATAAIDSLSAALRIEPARADAAEALARALMQSGRHVEAIAAVDAVIQLRGQSLNLALLRATALERAGETQAAEAEFRRVAQLHPDTGTGLRYLAAFYLRQERQADWEQVESQISRAVR